MKLYGKELDKELAKRKAAREIRLNERKSLRMKAKELDMKPSEYNAWESGHDVCPHEEFKKSIGGVHKPFLLMEICAKCRHGRIIAKIEKEEDFNKYEKELEEAFESDRNRNTET